jgi:hypothetical protein
MADALRDLVRAVDLLQVEVQREAHVNRTASGPSTAHMVRQANESSDRAMKRCMEAMEAIQRLQEKMPSLQFAETGEVAIAMRRLDSLVARRKQMNVTPRICGEHHQHH